MNKKKAKIISEQYTQTQMKDGQGKILNKFDIRVINLLPI